MIRNIACLILPKIRKEKCDGSLKTQGVHGIHLFSAEENLLFYEKLGFERVGLVKKSYYGHDDYFMNEIIN
jgi:ribosomal protein S18 acetylase RimI-like enzyme